MGPIQDIKASNWGTGMVAQELRTLAVLTHDLSFVSSTHTLAHNHLEI